MPRNHTTKTDRNPLIGPDELTLADVIEHLEADRTLIGTRRRDLISAIRRLGSLLERPLNLLPAALPGLKPGLDRLAPAQFGMSEKTLQNIKSNALAALRHTGAASSRPARSTPLTPAWQALYDRLPDRSARSQLSRFLRYCSNQDLAPVDIDDDIVSAFLEALRLGTFKTDKQIRDLHRSTTRTWNGAADMVSGWPSARLTIPDYRKPKTSLLLSAFPPSFCEDVERHLSWLAGDDPLAEHAPPKACKPSTVRLRRQYILLAASAYVHRGHAPADLINLAALIQPERVKEALRYYVGKNAKKSASFILGLCKALIHIARHDVRVSDEQLGALRVIQKKLGSNRPGLTAKNRDMLRQFDAPENQARLYALPNKIVSDVQRRDTGTQHQAVKVQVALAIELLLHIPIRQGNLIDLQIGNSLLRPGGPRGRWHVVLEGDGTKNGDPIEFEVPESVADLLELYLSRFRPRLADENNPYLFPGQKGPRKHQGTLSQQIKDAVYKHTGLKMTGHQFRHLAAAIVLDADPGNYQIVATLLGHKNIKTTVAFYTGLRTKEAGRVFSAIIERQRGKPPKEDS